MESLEFSVFVPITVEYSIAYSLAISPPCAENPSRCMVSVCISPCPATVEGSNLHAMISRGMGGMNQESNSFEHFFANARN